MILRPASSQERTGDRRDIILVTRFHSIHIRTHLSISTRTLQLMSDYFGAITTLTERLLCGASFGGSTDAVSPQL